MSTVTTKNILTVLGGVGSTAVLAQFSRKKNRNKVWMVGTATTLLSLVIVNLTKGTSEISSSQKKTTTTNQNFAENNSTVVKKIVKPKISEVLASYDIDRDIIVFTSVDSGGIVATIPNSLTEGKAQIDKLNNALQQEERGFKVSFFADIPTRFDIVLNIIKILKMAEGLNLVSSLEVILLNPKQDDLLAEDANIAVGTEILDDGSFLLKNAIILADGDLIFSEDDCDFVIF